MASLYDPCSCDSGKKFKFCCYNLLKNKSYPIVPESVTKWPISLCLMGKNWQLMGMTNVFIVRTMPNENYLVAIYLVDAWCLGVKNADLKINLDPRDLQRMVTTLKGAEQAIPVSYQEARSLVLGSIAYAAKLGFPPHPDWNVAQHLIEPNAPFEEKFEFGKDGAPLFIGDMEGIDYLSSINRLKALALSIDDEDEEACGLCGADEKLTTTACCDELICDDQDQYVMFSFARNSCSRNHDRYTLCAFHFNANHEGEWQDCSECKSNFEDSMEMYAYYGTNEYNFEILENPPDYQPTLCNTCSRTINLGTDGYTMFKGEYSCMKCKPYEYEKFTNFDKEL